MTTPDAKHRLSVILMADVVGYSRLMGRDEDETIERLKAFRQVFADLVGRSRGRAVRPRPPPHQPPPGTPGNRC